jgi:glycosyl transferase family 25
MSTKPLDLNTLVISMHHSQARRSRAQAELAKTALAWHFLDAVDGRQLPFPIPQYPAQKVKRLLGFELMPGEIGAFLSHRLAWHECVNRQQTTLIFEDDFILLADFEQTLEYLMHDFQRWNLMRLQALKSVPHQVITQSPSVAIVHNNEDALGCTAYLVKPDAAQRLLDYSEHIFEPIDHYIEHRQLHGLEFLAVIPYPTDISQTPTTVDRPERRPIRGWKKLRRSWFRWLDRHTSPRPWFPR